MKFLLAMLAVVAGLFLFAPLVRRFMNWLVARAEARPPASQPRPSDADAFDPIAAIGEEFTAGDPADEAPQHTHTVIDADGNQQVYDLTKFEDARLYLALQLIPEHYDETLRGNMVRWPLAAGFEVMLVLNFGGHESTVRVDRIADWPDRDTLYALALKQGLSAAYSPDFQSFSVDEPVRFDLASTPTNFIGAFALNAVESLEQPTCAVFGVPNWCNLVWHEWDGSLDHAGIAQLQAMVHDLFAQAARPGVSGLYFAENKKMERVRFADGQVVAPRALVKRLSHPD